LPKKTQKLPKIADKLPKKIHKPHRVAIKKTYRRHMYTSKKWQEEELAGLLGFKRAECTVLEGGSTGVAQARGARVTESEDHSSRWVVLLMTPMEV